MSYVVPPTYTTGQKLALGSWNDVATDMKLLQSSMPLIDVEGAEYGTPPTLPVLMQSAIQHTAITCDGSGIANLLWLPFSNAVCVVIMNLVQPQQYLVGLESISGTDGCSIQVWNANTNAAAAGWTGNIDVLIIGY